MSRTLTLKHPFQFGSDRMVTELTFGRLKGKHLRKLGATPTMSDLLELASKSAGEPLPLFDEMDAEDVMAVVEIIGDFLGGFRLAGETG
jgi:hypothetical protein